MIVQPLGLRMLNFSTAWFMYVCFSSLGRVHRRCLGQWARDRLEGEPRHEDDRACGRLPPARPEHERDRVPRQLEGHRQQCSRSPRHEGRHDLGVAATHHEALPRQQVQGDGPGTHGLNM